MKEKGESPGWIEKDGIHYGFDAQVCHSVEVHDGFVRSFDVLEHEALHCHCTSTVAPLTKKHHDRDLGRLLLIQT